MWRAIIQRLASLCCIARVALPQACTAAKAQGAYWQMHLGPRFSVPMAKCLWPLLSAPLNAFEKTNMADSCLFYPTTNSSRQVQAQQPQGCHGYAWPDSKGGLDLYYIAPSRPYSFSSCTRCLSSFSSFVQKPNAESEIELS